MAAAPKAVLTVVRLPNSRPRGRLQLREGDSMKRIAVSFFASASTGGRELQTMLTQACTSRAFFTAFTSLCAELGRLCVLGGCGTEVKKSDCQQDGVIGATSQTPLRGGVCQRGHLRCRVGSGRLEASEEDEVVGHDRGPDIGLEVVKPAPGAACQAVSPFEARDASFDAGAEVA